MNDRRPSLAPWLLALGLLLAGLWPAHAQGVDRTAPVLNQELAVVAGAIKQLLEGRNLDAIAVGEFTGPARAVASGGAGIKHALIDEFKRAGVRVDRRADLEAKGDFRDVEDRRTGKVALRLLVQVFDRAGAEITKFERGLFDVATMAGALGLSLQIAPDADPATRERQLRQGIDQPRFHLDGDRVKAAADSPFAVEVLVKEGNTYRPRPARIEDGLAFVPIRRGEVYAIKLINEASHEAAVKLTIDGLSLFAFSTIQDPKTHRPKYSHVVVPARGEGTVLGWHIKDRGDDSTDSFLITEFAKGAAAELKVAGEIGTITAVFSAAWPKGTPPPADEPEMSGLQDGRTADATARGPKLGVTYTPVERDVGKVRATISIRYTR